MAELRQDFTGQSVGRHTAKQIILFDSLGFTIEDSSTLRYVRKQTKDTRFVQPLDLLADPYDPRNIFGMLQGAHL